MNEPATAPPAKREAIAAAFKTLLDVDFMIVLLG
jgi:hypothetical protein